jgi:hypothetical protein
MFVMAGTLLAAIAIEVVGAKAVRAETIRGMW